MKTDEPGKMEKALRALASKPTESADCQAVTWLGEEWWTGEAKCVISCVRKVAQKALKK